MDGDGIDSNPEDVAPDINPCDGSQDVHHGTHVAGTIGAIGNNAIGIASVGNASLMHLRVLGRCGSGTSYDIAQAIYYRPAL